MAKHLNFYDSRARTFRDQTARREKKRGVRYLIVDDTITQVVDTNLHFKQTFAVIRDYTNNRLYDRFFTHIKWLDDDGKPTTHPPLIIGKGYVLTSDFQIVAHFNGEGEVRASSYLLNCGADPIRKYIKSQLNTGLDKSYYHSVTYKRLLGKLTDVEGNHYLHPKCNQGKDNNIQDHLINLIDQIEVVYEQR
jgi:hypothetical protein